MQAARGQWKGLGAGGGRVAAGAGAFELAAELQFELEFELFGLQFEAHKLVSL